MTIDAFGRRLLTLGRSMLPKTKERVRLAARHALAADEANKSFDFHTAAEEYGKAYELVAGVNDYFPFLYRFGEANALSSLGDLGDEDALRRAIDIYEKLVDDPSTRTIHDRWTRAVNGLGCALHNLGEREKDTKRLRYAVITLEAVRDAMRQEEDPLSWAEVQNNLGRALTSLGVHAAQAEYLNKAIVAFEAALSVRTRGDTPSLWADSQYLLGAALAVLGELEGGTENWIRASDAFEASATGWDCERRPQLWALSKEYLGKVRLSLGKRTGDRSMIASGRREVEAACEAYKAAGEAEKSDSVRESLKEFDAALAQ